MKSVSGTIFVVTLVSAIVAVGIAFWGGMETFKSQHDCTVDKTTKKATCLK